MSQKKAAFVTLLGRPSAGKSTLVNRLCGEHVAIVSPVPQTTRNAIRGIVNREQGQLVLVDTPGIHQSSKKFNSHLGDTAFRSASESDTILYVLDAARAPGAEEEAIAEKCRALFLGKTHNGREVNLAATINKIDLPSANVERAREFICSRFPALPQNRITAISAEKNQGIDDLLLMLFDLAPSGEPFYPEDYYTDQEIDFRIAEIIRGAAIKFLRQELPHSIYVEIADCELRRNEAEKHSAQHGQRLWVRAFIICERESQKGMIVGRDGKIIKAIGEISRKEMNRIFDWKVDLDLRVKTGKDWRHNDRILKKILGS